MTKEKTDIVLFEIKDKSVSHPVEIRVKSNRSVEMNRLFGFPKSFVEKQCLYVKI